MQGNCGFAPSDIRGILEGYCLDQEFITTVSLNFVQDSDIVTFSTPINGVLAFSKIESEALNAQNDVRIVDIEKTQWTLSDVAVQTGTFEANLIQYKALSDKWLVDTRDCQVIPVVKRMTGLTFDGPQRVQELHSGTGSTILILNHRPIRQVYAINLITNPENWVYVSPSSVLPIEEEGILKLKAVLESWQNYVPAFPRGTNNIRVDYEYGLDDIPCEVKRAIAMLTASQALAMIGARSGGGGISVQGYSKNYGDRGKYTDYRNELERWADSLLRPFVMGILGS